MIVIEKCYNGNKKLEITTLILDELNNKIENVKLNL